MATCDFDDCDRKIQAKGLCFAHYMQQRRGQDLRPIGTPSRAPRAACLIDGCDKPWKSHGLCNAHNEQRRLTGQIAALRPPGGQGWNADGYRIVSRPGHPNANSNGSIAEHRLIMSAMLGRALLPGENVHHKNGVKHDNRPENLELWITSQPSGQRLDEVLAWVIEFSERYSSELQQIRGE